MNIRVADVHAQANPVRNAIHRAGEYLADAYCCNRVNRSASSCCALNRQNQLSGRAESIVAVDHQDSSGVSARTLDHNAQTRGRSDFCDDAERRLLAFQKWSLLNVQFDKCLVVTTRQLHFFEFARETRLTADLIERGAVVVG